MHKKYITYNTLNLLKLIINFKIIIYKLNMNFFRDVDSNFDKRSVDNKTVIKYVFNILKYIRLILNITNYKRT